LTNEELWLSLAQRRRLRRVSLCLFNNYKSRGFLHSTFGILLSKVSFSIKLSAFQASGWADS
jgi:hypothetical protein